MRLRFEGDEVATSSELVEVIALVDAAAAVAEAEGRLLADGPGTCRHWQTRSWLSMRHAILAENCFRSRIREQCVSLQCAETKRITENTGTNSSASGLRAAAAAAALSLAASGVLWEERESSERVSHCESDEHTWFPCSVYRTWQHLNEVNHRSRD